MEAHRPGPPQTVSYSHAATNRRVFERVARLDLRQAKIIDVAAGEGFFCRMLGQHLQERYGLTPSSSLSACDLFPENFKYPEIACRQAQADQGLPYADASFDVACRIEVIEHLENPFAYVRELHRILRAGGRAIITTPNILNVNSRVRFLHSGFWLLFDPFPLGSVERVHLADHIMPIGFYYLAAMLRKAGFREIHLDFDRVKKSGMTLALLLYPLIRAMHEAYRAAAVEAAGGVRGEPVAAEGTVFAADAQCAEHYRGSHQVGWVERGKPHRFSDISLGGAFCARPALPLFG